MSLAIEPTLHLFDKLRLAERLARRIAREHQVHAEPGALRQALDSSGSTVQSVINNWILGLIESRPEMFHDPDEAELFVGRCLRDRMLEAFPGSCEL